jgi:biotin carboxylase
MVGLNKSQVRVFDDLEDTECYLIEEEQLYTAEAAVYDTIPIAGKRFGDYQQSESCIAAAVEWNETLNFDAVVPGTEYAVLAGAAIAQRLGLRSPGTKAVRAFTHKVALRRALEGSGVLQPRYAQVASAEDVREFFTGDPIILKPANRQASVGVIRIDDASEIDAAWAYATTADEGWRTVDRDLSWDFIVEDFLTGDQISVESIVADGHVEFHNFTSASTFGDHVFSEVQHLVPGPLNNDLRRVLTGAVEAMFDLLGVESGFFHSEWKVTSHGVFLLECAARAPGDSIPELIKQAYGFDPYAAHVRVLLGQPSGCAQRARAVAGIRFFHPDPGILREIKGVEWAEKDPRIFEFFVKVKSGEVMPDFKNSWSRAGCFAFVVDDAEAAKSLLLEAEERLSFVVDPVEGGGRPLV